MVLENYTLLEIFQMLIWPAVGVTLKMVFLSGFFATVLGFAIGIVLVVTQKGGLCENAVVYKVLNVVVNIVRSFPFIILMISIIPFTRLIVGSSIGDTAALVPLTVAAAPFIGRIIQNALKEVDAGLVEAARSFGASRAQIVFRVMLKEAVPSIVSGLTLAVINLLSCSAMAGAIGAGGLGSVALIYGYQNFNETIMYSICAVLIVLVALLQFLGDFLYKKLK